MKEALVAPDLSVSIRDVPTPQPGPDELLIKVIVAGSNPKDWKHPHFFSQTVNTGDDVAGYVSAVGANVAGFREGDRVAGYHVIFAPGGTFAEYAIVPAATAFLIPPKISFEEAATVPLTAYTAVVGLFRVLELPSPWDAQSTTNTKRPLVIYGASSAVGAFAIKLAHTTNVHPVIAIGSGNSNFVMPFLDETKGDKMLDYTSYKSGEELSAAILRALAGERCFHALDAITLPETFVPVSKTIAGAPHSQSGMKPRLAVLLPNGDYTAADESIDVQAVNVAVVHGESELDKLLGLVWSHAFRRGLEQGWLVGHPYEVIPGGLDGLADGLTQMKDGKVRGKKLLFRVTETNGMSSLQ
ncbi:chaperonin 10-like protein [Stachybotrys elegans]|uniref:Chaperonin 10-like protein n=1 Tax=Stachybotrys elegans TaxID=80388 RepID=A0A8K0WLU7_9HYPO|nr:chaperonin 10-like protein [Stachybotrys elegans]